MADDPDNSPGPGPGALALIITAETQLEELGKAFDAPGLTALRTLISGYPEMGSPGAGEVVASLFMLLGRFLAAGRSDRQAILVHLQAWRLMTAAPVSPEAQAQLLDGLRTIRDIYDDAAAA